MTTYVALLRGINVGGKTPLGMAALRSRLEGLGFASVRTYINSGNAIFTTDDPDPRHLEHLIEQELAEHFQTAIPVLVRTLSQISEVIDSVPAHWFEDRNLKCNVIFLRQNIEKPSDLEILPAIEELHCLDDAWLWAARRDSLSRSTMLKLSRFEIYQQMTVRSLKTTRAIYALMEAA